MEDALLELSNKDINLFPLNSSLSDTIFTYILYIIIFTKKYSCHYDSTLAIIKIFSDGNGSMPTLSDYLHDYSATSVYRSHH